MVLLAIFGSRGELCFTGLYMVLRPHQLCHLVFFLLNKCFYLFLAVLGFRCCTQAFSSCGERGLLFAAVHGLLTAVAPLVAEHGL